MFEIALESILSQGVEHIKEKIQNEQTYHDIHVQTLELIKLLLQALEPVVSIGNSFEELLFH